MYTGARRSADPTRVGHPARPTTPARAALPPAAEHAGDVTPRSAVSPGTAARGDALGAILARAVAERPHGGSGTAGHTGPTLQRFLGLGKKKKKPPRPTQALPAPPRPTQDLPAPARPKQALPPAAAVVPQTPSLFEARQFDMDPFEARQFNLDSDAPAVAPPPPAAQPAAPAAVAPSDDGFAPELVPDETGLVPVAGNPYLEWLVSSYASDRGTVKGPRSYGALRNLQVIASLAGYPPPRPIDRKYLAASSTAYDWGFAY